MTRAPGPADPSAGPTAAEPARTPVNEVDATASAAAAAPVVSSSTASTVSVDTAAAVPHASGTADQRPLSEVLAGTALAERLQVQRTHGGRVGHLIPRLGARERQYRSKFSVALCGAHVHFEPGRADSPILQRPGCRRCAAVLRELTSTPDTDGIRWSASTGGTVLHA